MKRIFLSALIGVGMVALIFPLFSGSGAARTPQSFPLVCRGGPSMKIGPATPGSSDAGLTFTRGTKPAREGLAPGECSWVDRGMLADEPDKLYQNVEGKEFAPGKKPWFLELHSPDKYWTFQVSNQVSKYGGRQLTATSAEPLDFSEMAFTVMGTARLPSDLEVRPRSYPLVCRGGPSLEIVILRDETKIGFEFVRGTKPAGDGLAPGECSWIDRGMNADEPPRLSQYVEDMDSLKAGTLAPENGWYEDLHSPDRYWTFMVYSKWRQLNVTSARRSG